MSVTLSPFLHKSLTLSPDLPPFALPLPLSPSPIRIPHAGWLKIKDDVSIIYWQCRTVQEYLKGIIKKFDYNVTCEHIYTSIASGKRRKAGPLKVNSNNIDSVGVLL
jgi:hypothetical protein